MDEKLIKYFNGDELAASVWLSKYAQPGDITPDDMHKRMAKELARIELDYHYLNGSKKYNDCHHLLSHYGKMREFLSEQKIYDLFKDFKYIVPQGSIMSQLGSDKIGSLSNCFVVGQPHDSYNGIFQKDEEAAQLMKRRGGVGIDVSTLRPSGTSTTNAAKSSTGPIPFCERYSNTTREVAQDGRRGALMLSIDVRHPDSPAFAVMKNDPTKVTGANISIFLPDEFMKAVENDEDYILRFPVNTPVENIYNQLIDFNKAGFSDYDYNVLYNMENAIDGKFHFKKVKAKELYETIVDSAWQRAEPGQLFIDKFHSYSPDGVYPQYRGVTTNPCGEIFMQPYDACRLMAMNLFSYVKNPFTPEAIFDFDLFFKYSYEMQRLMDNIVDLEIESIDRIIMKIHNDTVDAIEKGISASDAKDLYRTELNLWEKVRKVASGGRRTGSGITALGDTLAALGLKYDSEEGIKMIDKIFYHKMEAEKECSIDLAITRGTFEGWDANKEFTGPGFPIMGTNDFYQFIWDNFPNQAQRMYKYGRRNISWSTVAPTGTVSLMTQTTSGLEPLFMGFYTRRVKVNPGEGKRIDFVDKNGDNWTEMPVFHEKFKQWIELKSGGKVYPDEMSSADAQAWFEESPWFGSTANDINWVKRVEIQAVIQKYISHSISSTINLPSTVTKEEVAEIYVESWKQGLKGVTVYRDGCRSGVLISNDSKESLDFEYKDAPKRPKKLKAEVHKVSAKGNKYSIIVGLFDNKPYEIFVNPEHELVLEKGKILKKSKGIYILEGLKGEAKISETLSIDLSDEETALTRMISTSLRHGANIKFVVEQLNKSNGTIVSFSKAIARALKKYIPEGENSTKVCEDCGGSNVVFEEGCSKCRDCGSNKCG